VSEAAALEELFQALSEALDRVGPANHAALLAKLALLLGRELDDPERLRELLASAALDLVEPPAGGR